MTRGKGNCNAITNGNMHDNVTYTECSNIHTLQTDSSHGSFVQRFCKKIAFVPPRNASDKNMFKSHGTFAGEGNMDSEKRASEYPRNKESEMFRSAC